MVSLFRFLWYEIRQLYVTCMKKCNELFKILWLFRTFLGFFPSQVCMSSSFSIILPFLMSYLILHPLNSRSWSIESLAQPSLHLSHWILHCVCYAALSNLTNRNWAIVCCLISFNSDALFVYLSAGYRKNSFLSRFLPSFRPVACQLLFCRLDDVGDWRVIDKFVSVLLFQCWTSPPSPLNISEMLSVCLLTCLMQPRDTLLSNWHFSVKRWMQFL